MAVDVALLAVGAGEVKTALSAAKTVRPEGVLGRIFGREAKGLVGDVAKAGMKEVQYLNPGVGGALRGSIYDNVYIKSNTFTKIRETLGQSGIDKFVDAMNKGIVGAKGQNGIKMIAGNGIEYGGAFYKYEIKVLGKGMSHYRALGNLEESGNLVFTIFDKMK
jgi:hypothetical protein